MAQRREGDARQGVQQVAAGHRSSRSGSRPALARRRRLVHSWTIAPCADPNAPPPGIPAVPVSDRLEESIPLLLVALAIAVAIVLWRLRVRFVRRANRRRQAGYRFIDCLKAYTAWIDWHRDEPLLHRDPESLSIPAALTQAVQIKDEHFPELAKLMVDLLHTHRELMQYLWEENILRMTHASAMRPHYADPRYHNIRDRQDATLDSLFLRCRDLIGDSGSEWQRTRSDFSFSSGGVGSPSHPPA